ncbi:MAG: hypothetical protein V1917_03750 [Candidatus Gottesmanbacteria bacterium]
MKKRHLPRRASRVHQSTWLPFVDHSIFPYIFSFGRVKGIARLFLQLEMIFALLLVIGTSLAVIIHFWPY